MRSRTGSVLTKYEVRTPSRFPLFCSNILAARKPSRKSFSLTLTRTSCATRTPSPGRKSPKTLKNTEMNTLPRTLMCTMMTTTFHTCLGKSSEA
ncbi:hypothetical protein MT325_m248R [Paramecium bursaria chlorella virus MT325]|uniref:Uncharacterized protein m248R n=1 Tax=Paramecium bursaria Chlorella virus MT325 TaxID=346932 RepID=A7ITX8_PBCVM|nr:hypothetical protein MT325_m248R [Paramecium bursaria chlorella virus MT325]